MKNSTNKSSLDGSASLLVTNIFLPQKIITLYVLQFTQLLILVSLAIKPTYILFEWLLCISLYCIISLSIIVNFLIVT